jgi:hypothetical protein
MYGGEGRYMVLVGKSEAKRKLWRLGSAGINDIKRDLQQI